MEACIKTWGIHDILKCKTGHFSALCHSYNIQVVLTEKKNPIWSRRLGLWVDMPANMLLFLLQVLNMCLLMSLSENCTGSFGLVY